MVTETDRHAAADYRRLNKEEIERLEAQGCECADWSRVKVSADFDVSRVRSTRFSGDIMLGALKGEFELPGGFKVPSGISDATLHNCSVGSGAYIRRVSNYIANCDVCENAFIENIGTIVATGDSTFGIGTDVSVLNETGGREVPVYERLSAQLAWMIAMYRHRPGFISAVRDMIKAHAEASRSERCRIGSGALVTNTGEIRNVNIGDNARIEGASRLIDGTIASSEVAPVRVGAGVMAEHFYMATGACVEDSVVIVNSFIGQACHLSHLFSAHDSLFFANCACENGEACAVFAGPYTVTMHKSTLLIGGQYSFMNAGSGTNSSNHMYKLGPIHWGVMQRGVKTSSGAYMMWGGRVGAFSLLMGAHKRHADTALFPFSYLFADNDGYTIVVPGVMMKSCGLKRDETKWPARDKRVKKRLPRHDNIVFDVLNPPIVSSMLEALRVFDELEAKGPESDGMYHYNGLRIKHSSLIKGREVYRIAVLKYLYDKTRDIDMSTIEAEQIDWVDLAGQIMPRSILNDIYEMESLDEISEAFNQAYNDYSSAELRWVKWVLEQGWAEQMSEAEVAARQFDADIEADRLRSREMLSQHNNLLSL